MPLVFVDGEGDVRSGETLGRSTPLTFNIIKVFGIHSQNQMEMVTHMQSKQSD